MKDIFIKKGSSMKTMLTGLAFCTLLLPAVAMAADESYPVATGDDLGRVCANPSGATLSDKERERLLVCGSYIRGYLGYYSTARSLMRNQEYCLPQAGVSAEQVRRLYVAVLEKRPQIRDYPAAVDLTSILKAAYPCKPGGAP
jgi:hypothetical protein